MRGKLLGGRYEIVGVLASGGFGQTYIAKDMHRPGNPQCVVKHLQPTNANSRFLQNARRLFQTEAEILEKLGHHDQIPRLLAYFEENQEFYLVQEFIQGHTITAQLQPGKRWSENQVLQLLQEILGILVFVHDRGAIHRDIKPDNIIRRSGDGKLVLVDFGSVKQAWTQVITVHEHTHSIFASHLSATIAIGTPGYMPTEQGRGKPQPNSDIYALGMVAIQALTGISPTQLLEESETGEIVWQHQATVSEAIAGVITKMVRYNFRNRYQTATEALAAVEQIKAHQNSDIQPSSTSSSPSPPQSSGENLVLVATTPQRMRTKPFGGDEQGDLGDQGELKFVPTTHDHTPPQQIKSVPSGDEKKSNTSHSQLATFPDPFTTQPTVFVTSEHQTNSLSRNQASSAKSITSHPTQPNHGVFPTGKQLPLRIGAIITAMLTSVVALYALRWTPKANTHSENPTQTVEKCVQAGTEILPECRLNSAKELAAEQNFPAAIALAAQISPNDADYPAAKQLIAQSSNSLWETATNHYRSGNLQAAIATAKTIPQSSPNYDLTQATIKQWNWENRNRSNYQAAKNALAAGKWDQAIATAKQIDHPDLQKQAKPIIQQAQAKISSSKSKISTKPKPTIIKRPNSTAKSSNSVTSLRKISNQPQRTASRQPSVARTSISQPKRTTSRQPSAVTRTASISQPRRITSRQPSVARKKVSAARQLSRTIPKRLPNSLRTPTSNAQRTTRIVYKRVTRSTVKRTTRIIRKQVKRVTVQRRTGRSYRWVTKTVN